MNQKKLSLKKSVGVLCHPTALPGPTVCGTFGASTRDWLHCLSRNGIRIWQFLPIAPVDKTGSPYSSPSSFALNPWLLDVFDLVQEGFIPEYSIINLPGENNTNKSQIDVKVAEKRSQAIGKLLRENWSSQSPELHMLFQSWCKSRNWLDDHISFMELRKQNNDLPWWEWSEAFAFRRKDVLRKWRKENESQLLEHSLLQWHLDRQWQSLRHLAKELNVSLFGDLPFYVSRDSADVWANKMLFSIDFKGNLSQQSGVPPDYFSSTGQLWGTPVYRWWFHRLTRFKWWRNRVARQWELVDLLRLDHFRALSSYWSVPGDNKTAVNGVWKKSPGESLLKLLRKDCRGSLPLVAEDLGIITKEVEELRDGFSLPGMKVLQFAFDGDEHNTHLPNNMDGDNWIIYSGTHDNPTTLSWWNTIDDEAKQRVFRIYNDKMESPSWKLIDICLRSNANVSISSIQDLLCLDNSSRFNTPGTIKGNWIWRLESYDFGFDMALKSYGERSKYWGRK